MNSLPGLEVLDIDLVVARLPASHPWPQLPVDTPEFFSVTRTAREISIVCRAEHAPAQATVESGWKALAVDGPLDFALIGILSGIATRLARQGISIFAISTFDTDYILCRQAELDRAIDALRSGGYAVRSEH